MKCLDSDILIASLRGRQEARAMAEELDKESRSATTSISAFEIYYGATRSERKNENIREASKMLERLEIFPLDLSASRKAAEIASKLAEKGEPIDYRDAMIAGIAVENGLTLITRNKSHFKRIKGLLAETW